MAVASRVGQRGIELSVKIAAIEGAGRARLTDGAFVLAGTNTGWAWMSFSAWCRSRATWSWASSRAISSGSAQLGAPRG